MKIFDRPVMDRLSQEAAEAPRRRMNLNIHERDDARCHRFFNAAEPDTYIRPHRHLDLAKGETLVAIRGRIGVLLFSPDGAILQKTVIEPAGEVVAVDIAAGEWHCAVSLEAGSVFLEAKGGPYAPLAEAEKAPWSPSEGTPEAADYVTELRRLYE